MQLNLSFRQEGDLLHCEVEGPYSLVDFLRLADKVRAERVSRGASRVLVDTRKRSGDRSAGDSAAAKKPNRAERLAVVMRREAVNWMFENVATNRGLPTCETTDP